jgi:hypothetical protein
MPTSCHFFALIILLPLFTFGMDEMHKFTQSEAHNSTGEQTKLALLLNNLREFTPVEKTITGYVSVHYIDEIRTGIIESKHPDATFSTFHLYNNQNDKWTATTIDRQTRTLAEYNFDVLSMTKDHQTKIVALLEKYRIWPNAVKPALEKYKIWQTAVQPVTVGSELIAFIDPCNDLVIINQKKAECVENCKLLGKAFDCCQHLQLFATTSDNILIATNTLENGTVHLLSFKGWRLFSEPEQSNTGKPQNALFHNGRIFVSRDNQTNIYGFSTGMMLGKICAYLIGAYDDKVFFHGPDGLQFSTTNDDTKWIAIGSRIINLGKGFVGIKEYHNALDVLSPDMNPIQTIEILKHTPVMSHHTSQHRNECRCLVDCKLPLLHTDVTETILSSTTGRMLFAVENGLFILFKSKARTLDPQPLNMKEFCFLTTPKSAALAFYRELLSINLQNNASQYNIRNTSQYNTSSAILYKDIPSRFKIEIQQKLFVDLRKGLVDVHAHPLTQEQINFLSDNQAPAYILYDKLLNLTDKQCRRYCIGHPKNNTDVVPCYRDYSDFTAYDTNAPFLFPESLYHPTVCKEEVDAYNLIPERFKENIKSKINIYYPLEPKKSTCHIQ